jgi:GcrA cell cycle regulator
MGTNNRWSIWRDAAKLEMARELFYAGASASETALRIGGVSRNAVIGKWHRLGLVRAPKQRSRLRSEGSRTARRKEKIARTPKRLPPAFFAEPLPPPVETDIARVSFADLDRHHCRFPVGDPKDATFGFCGCKPMLGLAYCEAHARRAFTPATLKSEDRPSFNVSIRKPARELVNA